MPLTVYPNIEACTLLGNAANRLRNVIEVVRWLRKIIDAPRDRQAVRARRRRAGAVEATVVSSQHTLLPPD
jgi:hypothetical protein